MTWEEGLEETTAMKGMDTRDKILEAALELFSQNGYHATTTRKIAELAEVNEVTLFRQFNSKQKLFLEIISQIQKMGLDADRLDQFEDQPRQLIDFVINEMSEMLETNPRQYRLMQYAILEGVEGFKEEFAFIIMDKAIKRISAAFKKLQRDNQTVTNLDPEDLALMLITMIYGSVSRRIGVPNAPGDHYNRQETAEKIRLLFLKE